LSAASQKRAVFADLPAVEHDLGEARALGLMLPLLNAELAALGVLHQRPLAVVLVEVLHLRRAQRDEALHLLAPVVCGELKVDAVLRRLALRHLLEVHHRPAIRAREHATRIAGVAVDCLSPELREVRRIGAVDGDAVQCADDFLRGDNNSPGAA